MQSADGIFMPYPDEKEVVLIHYVGVYDREFLMDTLAQNCDEPLHFVPQIKDGGVDGLLVLTSGDENEALRSLEKLSDFIYALTSRAILSYWFGGDSNPIIGNA